MCHNSYEQDYRRRRGGLTEVPSGIPGGTRRVILHYNNIKELRADQFSHLHQCTYLDLGWNSISVIEAGAFRGLIKLELLSLTGNKLQEIRADMWEGLHSLTLLDLPDNRLTTVPYGCFQHLLNLNILWLARNQFPAVMSENFSELGKLQELILRTNSLTVIRGDMWIGLESLTFLDLYENKITVIEKGGFANLPMIEKIELRNNKLSTLSPDSFCFSPSPHPTAQPSQLTLLLDGIDLFCDSRLCWLKEAETNGLITLTEFFDFSRYRVECVNFPDVYWDEVALNCTNVGTFTSYASRLWVNRFTQLLWQKGCYVT